MYLWGHTWLSVMYALVIAAFILNGDRLSFVRSFPLTLAERYSYSFYLFHPLFLSLFFVSAGRPELIEGWYDILLTAGSLAVTVTFCALLFETVEKRCQRFAHR